MNLHTKHTVTNVIDGDTFDISPPWGFNDTKGHRIRIADLNAPELNESGKRGQVAILVKQRLTELVLHKEVTIVNGWIVDKFGRLVCDVSLDRASLRRILQEYLYKIS